MDDLLWSGGVSGGDDLPRPSAMFYLKSLQAQLRALRLSLLSDPAHQSKYQRDKYEISNLCIHNIYSVCWIKWQSLTVDTEILLLKIYITDLRVHVVGSSLAQDLFTGQSNRRFECLSGCLQAIKCWIDIFFSIPLAQYVGYSACIYAMMARCPIDLWRLSTCEHPEWDNGLVRETLIVSSVFEQTERNFSQVKDAAGLDRGGSQDCEFFSIMALRLRSIKDSWDVLGSSTELATPMLDQCT